MAVPVDDVSYIQHHQPQGHPAHPPADAQHCHPNHHPNHHRHERTAGDRSQPKETTLALIDFTLDNTPGTDTEDRDGQPDPVAGTDELD